MPDSAWGMVTQSDIVYVVDGIWDSITLNFLGFPCISLMGSRVSEDISKILALYKHLILVADNDKAGVDLFIDLSKRFKNVSRIKVPTPAKDIDEFHNKVGDEETKKLLSRI